jgi:hypothetical protein
VSTRREKHYECIFTSGGIETAVHVSAWDARSAEEVFRESLLASGIRVPGTIRVRGPKGRLSREARFEPTTAAPAAQG